jgi:hypothetical protein
MLEDQMIRAKQPIRMQTSLGGDGGICGIGRLLAQSGAF